jgi:sugar O-acyltransferase (sialic acid O-acetyltransferase NeuD family)
MKLLLYGSREFAATVEELVRDCGHETAGMLDDQRRGPGIVGSLQSASRDYPPSEFSMAIAIGYSNLAARREAISRVRNLGYSIPALVHPRAYVASSASIANGAMIMAMAAVDVRAKVGQCAVLWPGCVVNHDSTVGENVFISPGAIVCGCSTIGADCFIGAGSAIVDHADVPASSVIKMLSSFKGNRYD